MNLHKDKPFLPYRPSPPKPHPYRKGIIWAIVCSLIAVALMFRLWDDPWQRFWCMVLIPAAASFGRTMAWEDKTIPIDEEDKDE